MWHVFKRCHNYKVMLYNSPLNGNNEAVPPPASRSANARFRVSYWAHAVRIPTPPEAERTIGACSVYPVGVGIDGSGPPLPSRTRHYPTISEICDWMRCGAMMFRVASVVGSLSDAIPSGASSPRLGKAQAGPTVPSTRGCAMASPSVGSSHHPRQVQWCSGRRWQRIAGRRGA